MKWTVALALLASFTLTGCKTRKCKPGTMLLTVSYGAVGSSADEVEISVHYPGDPPSTTSKIPHVAGSESGTVELDFGGSYGSGRTLDVTVSAYQGSTLIAEGAQTFTLSPSCTTETIDLSAPTNDAGVDLAGDAALGDGGEIVDMSHVIYDLTGFMYPSNVSSSYLDASTTDWVVTAAVSINTSQTTAATAITPAAPAGVVYAVDGAYAVIAVHDLTISGSVAFSVTGSRPLIIVAGGTITVNGVIDAGGHGAVAGPAGSTAGVGSGHGLPGTLEESGSTVLISGGGGGAYGTVGAAGGGIASASFPGGATGAVYGMANLSAPAGAGGSGGGNAGNFDCTPSPVGGAGGGYLQLSARTSITVASFTTLGSVPSGVVSVAGGGGQACATAMESGGGGGGSGGSLFIEAPTVTIKGLLSAAGGGGGSGTTAGNDGFAIATPTSSSIGGTASAGQANSGGAGANSVTAGAAAAVGGGGVAATNMNGPTGAGGGGGGSGRIYVRAHGAPSIVQQTPSATEDTSLPPVIP